MGPLRAILGVSVVARRLGLWPLSLGLIVLFPAALTLAIAPGQPIDYAQGAFYPERWERHGIETDLVPWEGEQVVFLTTSADFDPEVMERFVGRLDAGWAVYESLVGRAPHPRNLINGKPTIAAVPDGRLTCGVGCGLVGATGIEVCDFYNQDYKLAVEKPDAFRHYYFYEMGRNYFVFGNRHSVYTTGFAVLMRYVCMDAVGCDDIEPQLREKIQQCEAVYAESDVSFLDAFTVQGRFDEKAPRLNGFDGPCDQPVIYASVMLKLRESHGGDEFLKRFFAQLLTCPAVRPVDADSALRQSMNLLVAASCAAGQDLTPVFVERWKMPVSRVTRVALSRVDWDREDLSAGEVIESLEITFD